MKVSQEFFCGIQDVGADGALSDKALLESLSDTATKHGALVGQSMLDPAHEHFAWMVLNWRVQVFARPLLCDTYICTTWAREYSRAFALRDFEVRCSDGSLCALATSKWAAVDLATGAMVRLNADNMGVYGLEPEAVFPDFKFRKMRVEGEAAETGTFTVNKSMIDCNNHVHNTVYLDLAAEVMPEGLDRAHFDDFEVTYRKEVQPGATVNLRYVPEGDTHHVVVEDPADGSVHAIVSFGHMR